VIPIYEYSLENQSKSMNLISWWFKFLRAARVEYSKTNESQNQLIRLKNQIEDQVKLELSETEIRMLLETQLFNKIDLNRLTITVQSLYDKKILNSIPGAIKNKEGDIQVAFKDKKPVVLKADQLYDIKTAQELLVEFLKQEKISFTSAEFIASILKEFLEANIIYSAHLTHIEEQKARDETPPVFITLKAGKVLIRKGDEIKPRHIKIFKMLSEENKVEGYNLSNFYLIVLIMCFLTMFGSKFFKTWITAGINKDKLYFVSGATLLVSIILYRVSLFLFPLILKNINIEIPYDLSSIAFALPCGFGVLTIAFIFNLQSAVIFAIVNALMGGILCDWNFNVFIYFLLGNLAASLGIEFYQRLKRTPIIKASILWMLPVNMIVIALFHLTKTDLNIVHLSVNVGMGVFSAIVAPILANFIIPIWENIFKLVTDLKLIELTNLNLPVFREMLEKAPGTYHHSLMVASLSEAVAQDIGISPLLQRAMALYHDIGKIDNPHFFTENHTIYKNPHENMSPRESAKNIISHIPDGIERAEKLRIPPMIWSSILQHHGSKRVRYFYEKAREMSAVDTDGFDDKAFRYQGDKPQNIENAIIMLADQVEAASKSLASPSDDDVKNIIQKIIDTNIEEQQFDECDGLSFKTVNIIANSFLKKLSSIYHMRISYPGFNFKEKEPSDKFKIAS
jgi:cyclic-di-AMP phosphodiesterase PgpH